MFPKYDTNLDPLRLVGLDRCLYTVADGNVAFEKRGGGVAHSFNCPSPAWRVCVVLTHWCTFCFAHSVEYGSMLINITAFLKT